MKSSQAISHVTVELVSKISKTVFVSIIRVDVISVVFTCYIFVQSYHLPQPRPHEEQQVSCPRVDCMGNSCLWQGTMNNLQGILYHSALITPTLMMQTESHWKLDTNSTLTGLVTQEDFIVTCHCESFKSCILIQFFSKGNTLFSFAFRLHESSCICLMTSSKVLTPFFALFWYSTILPLRSPEN